VWDITLCRKNRSGQQSKNTWRGKLNRQECKYFRVSGNPQVGENGPQDFRRTNAFLPIHLYRVSSVSAALAATRRKLHCSCTEAQGGFLRSWRNRSLGGKRKSPCQSSRAGTITSRAIICSTCGPTQCGGRFAYFVIAFEILHHCPRTSAEALLLALRRPKTLRCGNSCVLGAIPISPCGALGAGPLDLRRGGRRPRACEASRLD